MGASRLLVLLAPAAMAAAFLLLGACGGGGSGSGSASGSPEDAFEEYVRYLNRGQWGRSWDLLHPAHQDLIPREHYIQCADEVFSGLEVDITEFIETYEEDITIPATGQTTASTAITFEAHFSQGLLEDTQTDTVHMIEVDGEWRSILSDPEDYLDGECPS